MGIMQELRRDYKITMEALKEAREHGDKATALRCCEDLVRIADQMEYNS